MKRLPMGRWNRVRDRFVAIDATACRGTCRRYFQPQEDSGCLIPLALPPPSSITIGTSPAWEALQTNCGCEPRAVIPFGTQSVEVPNAGAVASGLNDPFPRPLVQHGCGNIVTGGSASFAPRNQERHTPRSCARSVAVLGGGCESIATARGAWVRALPRESRPWRSVVPSEGRISEECVKST
jgi:hypothetical protein